MMAAGVPRAKSWAMMNWAEPAKTMTDMAWAWTADSPASTDVIVPFSACIRTSSSHTPSSKARSQKYAVTSRPPR